MVIARSLRGMNDLFAADLVAFRRIEKALEQVFFAFGYQEIRTPILEELALFKRGIGETSDIVEKEMFLVEDGEHTYCLRPENTAAVVRALIERGGINEETQEKLYYVGPMFRKERPQKGRLRQFHQFGIEVFGIKDPLADVEVLVMVDHLIRILGLPGIKLKLNSLGTHEERNHYKSTLRDFLGNQEARLCEDCRRRMTSNPLRVLDCKNPLCQDVVKDAPKIIDALGKESRMHFDQVLDGISALGVQFELDHRLVRGLDYYNRTVFEFVADYGLGAQNAVVAGGRYDGLFLTLGNKMDLPAIGCAGGLERIALLIAEQAHDGAANVQIAMVGADDAGHRATSELSFALRKVGIAADFSLTKKSLKSQMRRADKLGAKFVAVIGEKEINDRRVSIKSFSDQKTVELALDAEMIAKFIRGSL